MPRGAKRDLATTAQMRKAKQFLDRRSFISSKGHRYLFGQDIEDARERAVDRARNPECLAQVLCQKCRQPLQDFFIGPNKAEMHHVIPKGRGGSDDDDNLIVVCTTCHRGRGGFHK